MALTAYEFIKLKAKIRRELARRNGCGPVNQYATSTYNFDTIPEAGGVIFDNQGDKVIDLALKVTDINGLKYVQEGDYVPTEIENLENKIDIWAAESNIPNSYTSCRGACTGLCVNACHQECVGCGNNCSTFCGAQCGGCTNSCTQTCGNNCVSTCGGECTGQCWDSCLGGCHTVCFGCTGATNL